MKMIWLNFHDVIPNTRNRCAIIEPRFACLIRATTYKMFMPKKKRSVSLYPLQYYSTNHTALLHVHLLTKPHSQDNK